MAPKHPHPLSFSAVPQATLTHFPEQHRQYLQQALDVSPDRISSCSVTQDTQKLFAPILEYAALCPNQLHPHASHSFFINPADPFEADCQSDDDSYYEEDSPVQTTRDYILPDARRSNISAPNLHMDVGATVVRWPPPNHLIPDFLLDRDDGNPYKMPPAMGDNITLHIMHYEMGSPEKGYDGMTTLHVVRVSTAHGDEALKQFLCGVMQWKFDRSNPEHDGKMYNLFRFKMCGDQSGRWYEQGARRARPLDSVVLEHGLMESLVKDIESFLSPRSKSWYIDHGLPYRRSYLFEGPPGTGKTSTIRVLAGKYSLPCYFLSMTNEKFSNQVLLDALGTVPAYSLLVLEDADSLFRSDRSSATKASVTFSGLLNALDGITSTEGLVTVMTTNHVDRLDPALIRGGRVDKHFRFTPPSRTQLKAVFRMFYEHAEDGVVDEFCEKVWAWKEGSKDLTVATLQQLFIANRERTAEQCVADLDQFLNECEIVGRKRVQGEYEDGHQAQL